MRAFGSRFEEFLLLSLCCVFASEDNARDEDTARQESMKRGGRVEDTNGEESTKRGRVKNTKAEELLNEVEESRTPSETKESAVRAMFER